MDNRWFGMRRVQQQNQSRWLRAFLQRGGVVAYPTESCFGLGCDPRSARGLQRVMRLKRRPQHKGLIVIGNDLVQLQSLLRPLSAEAAGQLRATWPAAKTFVLPARETVLPELRGKRRNQLAVRVPEHALARAVCRVAGQALVSTSCNRAGRRPCKSEREVRRQFGRDVWVVGGRVGGRKQPSEIIDWSSCERLR